MTLMDEVAARRNLRQMPAGKTIRTAAGVSQSRIAEELNVSRMTVSRWERGERLPRGPMLVAYTALLRSLLASNMGA